MNVLSQEERCTGCFACMTACPVGAIEISQDGLGNLYPQIVETRCINCGKCRTVCPEQTPLKKQEPKKAFAVWSLNPENRKTSASGGAAAEFYAAALEQGYWICGAEYGKSGSVIHSLRRDTESILRFKQSKYVNSDASCVYAEIKSKLDCGEKILMISLPCKIAGLLQFLGKPYENLLTVDLVCHGTPSADMLRKHISEVARISENFTLRFREDNLYVLNVKSGPKQLYRKVGREDPYLAAFLDGLSYRESCYQCSYAQPERISDITICDFWGLGAEVPFDHPYTGAISAVLPNTEKGMAFFTDCADRLFVEERSVSEAVKGNAQLREPTPKHPKRQAFETGCTERGFEVTVRDLLREEICSAGKQNRRNALRCRLRRIAGIFFKRYRG